MSSLTDRFETKRFALVPLSPIHVALGQKRLGTNLFLHGEKLYEIDEQKLTQVLSTKNLLEKYVDHVVEWTYKKISKSDYDTDTHKGRKAYERAKETALNPLNVFLEDNSLLSEDLARRSFAYLTELNGDCFMSDGHKQPFIPGTAIKGAIRTALMACALQAFLAKKEAEMQKKGGKFMSDFWLKAQYKNASVKELGKKLTSDVFEDYVWTDCLTGREIDWCQPHTDFLRVLTVRDAPIPDKRMLAFRHIEVLSMDSNNELTFKNFPTNNEPLKKQVLLPEQHLEDVGQEQIITFDVVLDRELLAAVAPKGSKSHQSGRPLTSLGDLLPCLKAFYQNVWGEEKKFFCGNPEAGQNAVCQDPDGELETVRNFYNSTTFERKANLRLGFGSGLLGTTMFPLLNATTRQEIRNKIMKKGTAPAPKSRKVVWMNDWEEWENTAVKMELLPFGWAHLYELSNT